MHYMKVHMLLFLPVKPDSVRKMFKKNNWSDIALDTLKVL